MIVIIKQPHALKRSFIMVVLKTKQVPYDSHYLMKFCVCVCICACCVLFSLSGYIFVSCWCVCLLLSHFGLCSVSSFLLIIGDLIVPAPTPCLVFFPFIRPPWLPPPSLWPLLSHPLFPSLLTLLLFIECLLQISILNIHSSSILLETEKNILWTLKTIVEAIMGVARKKSVNNEKVNIGKLCSR